MNVVIRGIRNAFRNMIRTFSLVVILGLSMGLALAMLVAHQAVGAKIQSVKSSAGNTISISPAGFRGFGGGSGTALTQAHIGKVKATAHVTNVSASLSDRLTSSDTNLQSAVEAGALGQRFGNPNGQTSAPPAGADQPMPTGQSGSQPGSTSAMASFTPPINVIGTMTPSNIASTEGGGTFSLKEGTVFDGSGSENVALVGTSVATKNNLSVGSTFTAYGGTTIKVVGIFDAGNTFTNNQIIMPLASVQKLSGQDGAITNISVTVDDISNVAATSTAIQSSLGTDVADVTNNAASADQVVSPLKNIQSISLYSLLGATMAGAIIILLTMVMIVRERRREIGVLKAIGANNRKIVGQFMTEAATLTLMASVVGIALGALVSNPITTMLVKNSTSETSGPTMVRGAGRAIGTIRGNLDNIQASVGWEIIAYGLGAAILIALVGSAIASFFIAKVRPAEVMRAE